jgi:signal transduction histidine kinase
VIRQSLRTGLTTLAAGGGAGRAANWRWDVEKGQFTGATDGFGGTYRGPGGQSLSFDEFLEDIHPVDRPVVRRVLQEAAGAGIPFKLEFRLPTRGEAVRYVECIGKPDGDGNGTEGSRFFVGTFCDITSVRRAEDRVSETHAALMHSMQQTVIGALARAVVQDVNQPLGVLANYAGAIKHWLSHPEPDLGEVRDAASGLMDAAIRAGEMVARMKAVARVPGLRLSEVSIDAAVQEILTLVRPEFERRSVCLDTRPAGDDVVTCCDYRLLQHALLSLLHEALDLTITSAESECQIWLSCNRAGTDGITISVEGSGIDWKALQGAAVIEPPSMARIAEVGFGLSVCRTIVEAHGGRLWAECRPGGGAIFRCVLPGRRMVR